MKVFLAVILSLSLTTSCMSTEGVKNKANIVQSMGQSVKLKHKDVKFISAQELIPIVESKSNEYRIVDARTTEEQMTSMIKRAMPKRFFENQKKYLKDKDIYVYCTIGERGAKYAKELMEQGFNVINLEGGILSWTHNGGIIESDGKPVTEVRFLNEAWNLLPETHKGLFP